MGPDLWPDERASTAFRSGGELSLRLRAERPTSLACLVAIAALVLPATIRAQDIVKEALTSFPRETIRLEYSRPAQLRRLPDYDRLRQRYLGPRLQKLEASLSQLGIQESNIDELALGWQSSAEEMDLEGLAVGRFDSQGVAERASARGLSSTPVADLKAYCLEPEADTACVMVLRNSLGAFGTFSSLNAMLEAREGRAFSLNSDDGFTKLIGEARTQAPIWGVAVGPAVADFFKAWMPGQKDLQLDWSSTFKTVEALAYSVEAAEKVHLDVKLDCTTPEEAMNLRQVLEGLKLLQKLAWQNQNPNLLNPFEAIEVDSRGRRIFLRLTTAYAALEGAGAPSSP